MPTARTPKLDMAVHIAEHCIGAYLLRDTHTEEKNRRSATPSAQWQSWWMSLAIRSRGKRVSCLLFERRLQLRLAVCAIRIDKSRESESDNSRHPNVCWRSFLLSPFCCRRVQEEVKKSAKKSSGRGPAPRYGKRGPVPCERTRRLGVALAEGRVCVVGDDGRGLLLRFAGLTSFFARAWSNLQATCGRRATW